MDKILKKSIIFVIVLLIAIQFIPVERSNPTIDQNLTLQTDENVLKILKNSCYDCHSYETTFPNYSIVAPISLFVASHVNDGRRALNFSKWRDIDPTIKKERLKRAIMTVKNERMPLPSYTIAHEDAKLTKEQKEILIKWFEEELKQ
jgi:hypothetical protein